MEKKQAITTVLVCLLILDNACEGSPIPSQVIKDFSFITASSFTDVGELENLLLRGTRPVPRRTLTLPTELPLIEEVPDPPDSALEADNEPETTPEEARDTEKQSFRGSRGKSLPHLQGMRQVSRRILRKEFPSLKEATGPPDSAYQADNDPQITPEKDNEEEASATKKQSSRGRRKEEPLPNFKPKVRHEGQSSRQGTSTTPEHNTAKHHSDMMAASDIRWQVAHLHESKDDNHHHVKKKKKSHSETHDPTASGSAGIVAGICAGILFLLCIVSGVARRWRKCRRRSQELDDPELGLVTPRTTEHDAAVSDEEIIFEKKTAGHKQKASKDNSKSESKPTATASDQTTHPPTTSSEVPQDTTLMAVSAATGKASEEMWIVNETSEPACPTTVSPMSEPSTWTPNETPPSTPNNTPSLTSESETWTKESEYKSLLTLPNTATSEENVTILDKNVSTLLLGLTTPPIFAEATGSSKGSKESVPIEINTSNSSTESCKTPVAPLKEVVITMEDEEEVKLVFVSSNECSSGELLYTSENPAIKETADAYATECDNEGNSLLGSEHESSSGELLYTNEQTKVNEKTINAVDKGFSCEPPWPPSPIAPLKVSTELKRGKAVGGRKAMENRLLVKHLTSTENSSGFHGDIILAVSKILTNKERPVDKSKGKRKIIREQTKKTMTSLMDSILLGKGIIMDEKVDTERDKKCASRRHVIHKALSLPAGSTLRPHSSLSQEIAFAQSIILPGFMRKKIVKKANERSAVIKERVDELKNPSFEERIQIAASTINPDEKTRDLNAKGYHKRSVIKMDSHMMRMRKEKSTFALDIQFVRNVICGPPAVDHERNPQMGCLCYYCKKHWKETGGRPCFKLPSAIAISKDVFLIDGKLYFTSPKTCSASPSPASNTQSASTTDSDPSNSHASTSSGSK